MKKYYEFKGQLNEAEKEQTQVDRDIEAVTAQIETLREKNKLEKSSAREIEIINLTDKKNKLGVEKAKEKITEDVFVKSFYDSQRVYSKIKLLSMRSNGTIVNTTDDDVAIKFKSDADYEKYKKLAKDMKIDVTLDEGVKLESFNDFIIEENQTMLPGSLKMKINKEFINLLLNTGTPKLYKMVPAEKIIDILKKHKIIFTDPESKETIKIFENMGKEARISMVGKLYSEKLMKEVENAIAEFRKAQRTQKIRKSAKNNKKTKVAK